MGRGLPLRILPSGSSARSPLESLIISVSPSSAPTTQSAAGRAAKAGDLPPLLLAIADQNGQTERPAEGSRSTNRSDNIYDVKPGGKETCNCGATDPELLDTHIELVPCPTLNDPTHRVIVEETPRWREDGLPRGGMVD